MRTKKPKDIKEYKKWLVKKHKLKLSDRQELYYETVTQQLKKDFENTLFWKQLLNESKNINAEYQLENNAYDLFVTDKNPEILIKPFESLLLKTFRKNIIDNSKWPESPAQGWILPKNWFTEINDIIRTSLVVKYLDGVEYLIQKIVDLSKAYDFNTSISYEAKEDGYYAGHLYLTKDYVIPALNWDTTNVSITVEIQVTTQLQEVIKKLLHKYYERSRIDLQRNNAWQWDYNSDEFHANYLGHILHYVEGMIMSVRKRQAQGDNR